MLLEAKNCLRNVIKEFNNVISDRDELAVRNFDIFKEETNVSQEPRTAWFIIFSALLQVASSYNEGILVCLNFLIFLIYFTYGMRN